MDKLNLENVTRIFHLPVGSRAVKSDTAKNENDNSSKFTYTCLKKQSLYYDDRKAKSCEKGVYIYVTHIYVT